jgi:hypothetical protein
MTDDFLQKLAAGPLSDPGKVFLPRGRVKGLRKRNPAELEDYREQRAAKKERVAREAAAHLSGLLDYYAQADVPFERVVAHVGVNETRTREGLEERGRVLTPDELDQFEALRTARLDREAQALAAKLARAQRGQGKRK